MEEKDVSLKKDDERYINGTFKIVNGYLYCKIVKKYPNEDGTEAVMLKDYEIEKAQRNNLGIVISVAGSMEYMQIKPEDIEKNIIARYDRVYGNQFGEGGYKLVKVNFVPEKR